MLQGVEHTHVAVANLILAALRDTLPQSGPPVVACHADNSASSALLEIWAALLTGGSLVLMTEATNVSIGQVICQAGVTAALLTGDELESILEVRYNPFHCPHPSWSSLIRHRVQRKFTISTRIIAHSRIHTDHAASICPVRQLCSVGTVLSRYTIT